MPLFRSLQRSVRGWTRVQPVLGALTLVTAVYVLVAAGAAALLGRSLSATALSPALLIAAVLVAALAFNPLRRRLGPRLAGLDGRAQRGYRRQLERLSRELTSAAGLGDVSQLVQRTLDDTLAPTHVLLFVRDTATGHYRALPDARSGQRLTEFTLAPDSALVRYLSKRAGTLTLGASQTSPPAADERARLAVLGTPLIVRLRGPRGLSGFLAIGPQRGGGAYRYEDLRFLESLSDPVALAVERAQVVDDLERRVRVQDVLSQVSRALNFAIDLDTLLELIYAQTLRAIAAPCFYIALRVPGGDELVYVFYNEGDDRLPAMEGRRWPLGRDLISEVARHRETLFTDDFLRDTLALDPQATPHNPHLRAWLGAPLLADTGGEVLGVMVAATTEPGVTFSEEQRELFWDIANLAASAIARIRLFEKTQQRARQLAAINEIARDLASEIGSLDRLLQRITEHAVHILNAQAGNLLLADDATGDLEYRVVVGGGGERLVGQRLPAGSGLAGATVHRAEPVIVTDLAREPAWWAELQPLMEWAALAGNGREVGSAAGFEAESILCVPLLAGGRVFGVLQILNKRDGSPFAQEDASLLETFAGQAAIAIENARLFDLTDQQLALRVQQLDTMQRVDQELNRSLKLGSVVDITMDWALRRSGASAGAMLLRDQERGALTLVASYGYASGPFAADGPGRYSADRGIAGRVMQTGQPSLITDVGADPDYEETLPGCAAQLTIPLVSGNETIGVMILESEFESALDLHDLDFVARLGQHASPAIANAQLFQALERANHAKSEFVSFVAHELKNPMTSLRGYTDLLLKGVAGPVSEQQAEFLNTIVKNVRRMETLVSDLNDLTKQQTNNLRLELAAVDFGQVVAEALRAQQRLFDEKGQTVTLDLPDDLPAVWGDSSRLQQVLDNLLSNAHKYTLAGGTVAIRAEAAPNQWDTQGAPLVVHGMVADTGIGMHEDDLRQLFTPYFRSDNPQTREQPGTGLGLSITKGLIELHGGQIWVESAPGAGTTFHFTIPVADAPPDPPAPTV